MEWQSRDSIAPGFGRKKTGYKKSKLVCIMQLLKYVCLEVGQQFVLNNYLIWCVFCLNASQMQRFCKYVIFFKYLFCFKCMFCTEAWVTRCGPCCGGCLKYIGCKAFWPTHCPAPGLFSWCIASSHIHSARQGGKCLCMALYSHPPNLSKWANLIFCPSFQCYYFCVLLFPLPFSKLFFFTIIFFSQFVSGLSILPSFKYYCFSKHFRTVCWTTKVK